MTGLQTFNTVGYKDILVNEEASYPMTVTVGMTIHGFLIKRVHKFKDGQSFAEQILIGNERIQEVAESIYEQCERYLKMISDSNCLRDRRYVILDSSNSSYDFCITESRKIFIHWIHISA